MRGVKKDDKITYIFILWFFILIPHIIYMISNNLGLNKYKII